MDEDMVGLEVDIGVFFQRLKNRLPAMLMQLLHKAGRCKVEAVKHGTGQLCLPTYLSIAFNNVSTVNIVAKPILRLSTH